MWKICGTVSIYFCFMLCGGQIGMAQDGLESMKLLSPDVGWAATEHRVFWTSDAGQRWKDITPPTAASGKIAAIFFLDTATGWALISRPAETEPQLSIAYTNNSGESWSANRIAIPNLNPESTVLGGDGFLDFVDPLHGWINLSMVGSSNFNPGALLSTDDGGKTWTWVAKSPGIAGPMRFINVRDGWLAGGPGNGELYVTHDGSRSWQKIVIARPPQVDKAAFAVYDLPSFENDISGTLSVTYEGAEGTGAAIGIFNTRDGGRTWTFSDVLSNLPEDHHGIPYPSAIVDSSVALVTASNRTLTLTKAAGGQRRVTTGTLVKAQNVHISRVSLVTDTEGWVLTSAGLLSTKDSGITWVSITPPQLKDAYDMLPGGGTPTNQSSSRAAWTHLNSPVTNAALGTPVSIHVGFDQCAAATVAQMLNWWNHSPYYDTGIYIGGVSRSCAQPNLTASWVTQIRTQGWGLIPLWPGPQAPCACASGSGSTCVHFPNVFSSTASTARAQGVAEADSAASAASVLGLPPEIIYYDLENYPSTCSAAASAFVNGWVSELHNKMPYAGVYGNSTDANRDWAGVPDAVFIAQYSSKVTVYGLNPLSDTGSWSVNQRIHQYVGGHNETWGGTQFNIDNDIEDAIIDVCSPECPGEQGLKNFTYSFKTITYPGAGTTEPQGLNNKGQVVGWYQPNVQFPQTQGFYYNGSFSPVQYPGYSYNQSVFGINNLGTMVGMYWVFSTGALAGYEDVSGSFSTFTYPQGENDTVLDSISDDGLIAGACYDCGPNFAGGVFLYQNGAYNTLFNLGGTGVFDEWSSTVFVNGAHQVVGELYNDNCYNSTAADQPFLYNNNDGSSVLFDCFAFGEAYGINNNDVILMLGEPNGDYRLYDYANGTYIDLPTSYPGVSSDLEYSGINDKGQLIGKYLDSNNRWQGFIATPQ